MILKYDGVLRTSLFINSMNNLLRSIVRSHLFLSFSSFVFLFGLYSKSENSLLYALMISFGIIGIYNGHRLWKCRQRQLPTEIYNWTFKHKRKLIFLSVVALSISISIYGLFFSGYLFQNLLALVCVLISIFYVKRIRKLSLRDIPYLKVWFVIAIWYCLFFVFPFLFFGVSPSWMTGLLLLIIILIPSDIKDIYYDRSELKTIPQVLGVSVSLKMIQGIIFLALILLLLPIERIQDPEPWIIGFTYFLLLTIFYVRIGYRYFFVFADASFLLIGLSALFLN